MSGLLATIVLSVIMDRSVQRDMTIFENWVAHIPVVRYLGSHETVSKSKLLVDNPVYYYYPDDAPILKIHRFSNRLTVATMCAIGATICTYIRFFLDSVIDFIFSLFWGCSKRAIPDVEKKHAFLSESVISLADKIKRRELRSEELVKALVERIKQVNPLLNAIAADRFDAALEEAKEIDRQLDCGTCEVLLQKPLLGVPFTTKESQSIKGMPLTLGLWCRRDERAMEDSEAVARLKAAGAIPLASTNLPELLIWQETRNPVYGMTNNPHHTGRSPGGSSGAEAALVSSYASCVSLCSDVGGSTRIPAFYCGMFGHHPTAGTTNTKGSFLRNGDEDSMYALGFISRHVEDLAPLTNIIAGDKASMLKLDRNVDVKDLKFYYVESSNDFRISPLRKEMKDAMQSVINKISADHNITPQPYYHKGLDHMYQLWSYWMTKEPGVFSKMVNNNQADTNGFVELLKKMVCLSNHCFYTIMRLIEMQTLGAPQAEWAENLTKDLKHDLFSKLGDNGVLLFPSAPHAAPYHYSCLLRPYNFAYWALVNVLKCPATQVPLGKNKQNLPFGIQVLAAPYNDALCLTVAKYLEEEFGGAIPACKVAT